MKKLIAALCASAAALALCTACTAQDSPPPAETQATVTSSAPPATTALPAETTEAVTTEALDLEEQIEPVEGEAYLYLNDGEFYVSYDGTANSLMSYAADCVPIKNDGAYTVSVNAGTKGCQHDISDNPGLDYRCNGIAFAAVIVKGGKALYPDLCIEIKEIRADGKPIPMTAKNYTSSEDGKDRRANIYNIWVDQLPDDARTAEGTVTGENGTYSPRIVDPDSFVNWQKIEVDFVVTGTGKAAPGTE